MLNQRILRYFNIFTVQLRQIKTTLSNLSGSRESTNNWNVRLIRQVKNEIIKNR